MKEVIIQIPDEYAGIVGTENDVFNSFERIIGQISYDISNGNTTLAGLPELEVVTMLKTAFGGAAMRETNSGKKLYQVNYDILGPYPKDVRSKFLMVSSALTGSMLHADIMQQIKANYAASGCGESVLYGAESDGSTAYEKNHVEFVIKNVIDYGGEV